MTGPETEIGGDDTGTVCLKADLRSVIKFYSNVAENGEVC